jgi:hypothetical protein
LCGGDGAVATYIHHSYDAIEQDIASGQGPHLDTLKSLTGGDENFNADVRTQFSQFVVSPGFSQFSHYEKSEALFDIVVAAK